MFFSGMGNDKKGLLDIGAAEEMIYVPVQIVSSTLYAQYHFHHIQEGSFGPDDEFPNQRINILAPFNNITGQALVELGKGRGLLMQGKQSE